MVYFKIMKTPGILYIVATPIGNLSDITLRALETLKSVDLIACEDTRVTAKLLNHYNIKKPLISYHQHTKLKKIELLINELKDGKNIALVTDAGTPGISDPGNVLIAKLLNCHIAIVPVPGPSALTALISVAGIDMQRFIFLGFPPHKKGREKFFKEAVSYNYPVVYYESPYRVLKNLALLEEIQPGKDVIIGRELTKMFEEVVRGKVSEAIKYFTPTPKGGKSASGDKNESKLVWGQAQKKAKIRGEFVVIVCGT